MIATFNYIKDYPTANKLYKIYSFKAKVLSIAILEEMAGKITLYNNSDKITINTTLTGLKGYDLHKYNFFEIAVDPDNNMYLQAKKG